MALSARQPKLSGCMGELPGLHTWQRVTGAVLVDRFPGTRGLQKLDRLEAPNYRAIAGEGRRAAPL